MSLREVTLAWAPAAAFMLASFVLSSMVFPQVSPALGRLDLVVHFTQLAILGFLTGHAGLRTWPDRLPWRAVLVGALIAASWGLFDELHQAFVPGRSASVADLSADTVGALFGALSRLGLHGVATPAPEHAHTDAP